MPYKNIVTGLNEFVPYHDDMDEKDSSTSVEVIKFPYSDIFMDFRLFNGIRLDNMDEFIGRIKDIFVEIANVHAYLDREEKLKEQREADMQYTSKGENKPQ